MKTLNLHVDYIEWEPLKKALKSMEDLSKKELAKKKIREALVVLMAVEKGDGAGVVGKLVKDIKEVVKQVKAKNVVLYPYAHLSKNLSSPTIAVKILESAEKKLIKEGFKVSRAPFGYYKSFELKVKGHPLSELSREIKGNEEDVAEVGEKERKRLLREISKSKLDTSKLKENDHRIIGRKLDLWSFNEVAPGMVFWHDKGLHIRSKLIEYWRELHRRENYEEISTPQIMDRKIWEISGHWSKYSQSNFKTGYEGRDFLVKPMNCPGGMLVYKSSPKSYKDLPLRMGELGLVHRVELSGVLAGLFRVVQFIQDDAHIFCTEKQVEKELIGVLDLTKEILDKFGLKIDHVELSTRPKVRIGTDEEWAFAEKSLENVLKKKKMKYKINKGDGAFYGAKIDYHIKDSLGRSWQVSTIQFDSSLPRRFNLVYLDANGKEKRPIMIHRAIYGSLERFIGIITEHFNGNFPLWLNPNQIKVMTLNNKVDDYAKKVVKRLLDEGFRVELDDERATMGKKVRDALIQKFSYLITIGEEEKKGKKIAVRARSGKKVEKMDLEKFIKRINEEVEKRK